MRKVQVLVQTRDGRKTVYEVDRFGTVGSLKTRIGRAMSVPMGFSRLSYKGRVLPNQSVLEDVGANKMSTLDLSWEPVVLTPKQLSEKESECGKIEGYGQMVRTGGLMQTLGSFQDADAVAPNGGIVNNGPTTDDSSPRPLNAEDELEEELEDQDMNCASSDGLDFFAIQPSFKKSDDLLAKGQREMAPLETPETPKTPETPETLKPPEPLNLAKNVEKCAATKAPVHKKKGKKNRKKK
ncbi:uncharacterized protein LOC6525309 [Drosophila yakuba]|uniref:Ubiquitin-like domain-containing protein n=1 Tax=Drosophila yakuba TaxID=7245 RepID=B4Q0B6_DROYA|nr:uncharacterized protein LOC6525309 [Drosophila yakuba]EDX02253.1 uncharacterized protein Dyak_GE17453 [Drosophila yakuba]